MYKAADIVFEAVDCGEVFLERAEKYAVEEGEPEFTLTVTEAELAVDKEFPLSDDWKRYMYSGSKFYFELIKRRGMMLHSSAVVKDGRAYLFSANSGVGKSTHAEHWLRRFPDAYILNDDKPALRRTEEGFFAYGTPWSGKHDVSRNEGVPVSGIAFIERASYNFIEPLSPVEAAKRLIPQTVRRIGGERMRELLDTVDVLLREVPVYRLGCINDISAAETAAEAMCRSTADSIG